MTDSIRSGVIPSFNKPPSQSHATSHLQVKIRLHDGGNRKSFHLPDNCTIAGVAAQCHYLKHRVLECEFVSILLESLLHSHSTRESQSRSQWQL